MILLLSASWESCGARAWRYNVTPRHTVPHHASSFQSNPFHSTPHHSTPCCSSGEENPAVWAWHSPKHYALGLAAVVGISTSASRRLIASVARSKHLKHLLMVKQLTVGSDLRGKVLVVIRSCAVCVCRRCLLSRTTLAPKSAASKRKKGT